MSAMDAERWDQLNELFEQARALPGAERHGFLHRACAGDTVLRDRVHQLLRADDYAPAKLPTAALVEALVRPMTSPPDLAVGRRFGPYRIVAEIGRGGMGVVYLAERADDQYDKRVAIKLIKQGIDTEAVLRLFKHERQILAALDHPNITRLLDAGTADDGRPYFVMEYVEGTPIREYCAADRLGIRHRLELFRRVCAAVTYAHRHLIVHRDIKPSNILVTADGEPKLLDFGIAKLMDADRAGETIVGGGAMTPEYASPEQVEGGPVTTLSDVYSLGLVLRDLLVEGSRPGSTAPGRGLRGELATIVSMALRIDAAERYQSVEQLSDDIGRYLGGLPVLARKDAPFYRFAKFVRRNAVAAAATLLVVVTLVGGIIATRWQAVQARDARNAAMRERDRAVAAERAATVERDRAVAAEQAANTERDRARRAEELANAEARHAEDQRMKAITETRRADTAAAIATAVRDFLQQDLLAQASSRSQAAPNVSPTPDLTVRAALDRAAQRIGGRFESKPEIEAGIRQTIGVAYKDLGVYSDARQQLERALALRKQALGPRDPDTLTTMSDLGTVYARMGDATAAEQLLTTAVDGFRAVRGENDRSTLAALNDLAVLANNQGRKAEVGVLLTKILSIQVNVLGEADPDTLAVMHNLATLYNDTGKYADAETLYARTLAVKRRVLGDEHPSTLMSMQALGVTYRFEGKYEEAKALLTRTVDVRGRVLGPDHPETLVSVNSLGLVYGAQGDSAEAERLLLQALAGRRRILGETHPTTLANMNNVADLYRRLARTGEAETLFRLILDARRRQLGPDHPTTIAAMSSLGEVQLLEDKRGDAQRMLRDALDAYAHTHADTWRRYYTQSLLGQCLARNGRHADAEPLLAAGLEGMIRLRTTIPAENRAVLDDVSEWLARERRALDRK